MEYGIEGAHVADVHIMRIMLVLLIRVLPNQEVLNELLALKTRRHLQSFPDTYALPHRHQNVAAAVAGVVAADDAAEEEGN